MEKAQFRENTALDYMWTPRKLRSPKVDLLPITTLTLQIWTTILESLGNEHTFHTKALVTALKAISPDMHIQTWLQ
ncbi:Hypothetical predicted protein, partial [Pelobates cultripes]